MGLVGTFLIILTKKGKISTGKSNRLQYTLNILKKNSLRADEKLNSPLTSENLPPKKKNTSYFKYFGKEFPSRGYNATFGKFSLK